MENNGCISLPDDQRIICAATHCPTEAQECGIEGLPPEPVTDYLASSAGDSSEKGDVFKGNIIACDHDATINEFTMYIDPKYDWGGDTTITFAIFEQTASGWTNIFDTSYSFDNAYKDAEHYSTGDISVDISAGKTYMFGAMWNYDCRYYYENSAGDPLNFGDQIVAAGKENLSGLPSDFDQYDGYTFRMNITSTLK